MLYQAKKIFLCYIGRFSFLSALVKSIPNKFRTLLFALSLHILGECRYVGIFCRRAIFSMQQIQASHTEIMLLIWIRLINEPSLCTVEIT